MSLPLQLVSIFLTLFFSQTGYCLRPSNAEHQKVTHISEKVFHKAARLKTTHHHFFNRGIQSVTITRNQGINRPGNQLGRSEAQQHRSISQTHNTRIRAHHQLVQHGERIAHRATTGSHRELQNTRFWLHMLFLAHVLQERAHNFWRNQAEGVMVSARTNSRQNLFWLSRRKDEDDVLRRLFHNLEQSIEALRSDHMSLIEDEDLIAVASRSELGALTNLTSILHRIVRSSINLHHVDRTLAASSELLAALAFSARVRSRPFRAVDAAGENTRSTRLTASARPGEQVGLDELAIVQSTAKWHGHLVLTDHSIQGIRTIAPIQC